MNSKATKTALVTSLASLVLCFTMLMGTTFAWFVDRVENTNNRIEAGNLEVDLVMLKNGDYVSIADGTGDIFAEAKGSPVNWQPGMEQTVYLGIRNTGSLPIAYTAAIKVNEGGLSGVLDYKIETLEGSNDKSSAASRAGARTGLIDSIKTIKLGDGVLKKIADDPTKDENKDETHYYAFTVHMKDNASEIYQDQTISLEIHVNATQISSDDSADDDSSEPSGLSEEKKVTTLSGTSWKLKEEITDYDFLEEKEEESDDALFPDECTVSDGENEYELSALSMVSLGETKLLMAVPSDSKSDENEEEEQLVSVFVYHPKTEESEADDEFTSLHGWYLIGYEDIQKLLADDNAKAESFTESAERIENTENLPVITFAESDADILENNELISWLYSNAEMQISEDEVSE